jgi:hypothetical protein
MKGSRRHRSKFTIGKTSDRNVLNASVCGSLGIPGSVNGLRLMSIGGRCKLSAAPENPRQPKIAPLRNCPTPIARVASMLRPSGDN